MIVSLLVPSQAFQMTADHDIDSPLATGGCQRITVPVCSGMKYKATRLPNMLGQEDQQTVALVMNFNVNSSSILRSPSKYNTMNR